MNEINPRLAVKKLKALCFSSKNSLPVFRTTLDETFTETFLPNRVDCRRMQTGGVKCDMFIPEICAKNRMILYIHGGSFVGGSCDAWRSFCASFAHEASSRLMLPELRLAPEFPFPSAIADALAVFNRMYEKIPYLYIAADASGASIAMGLFLQLSPQQRRSVKGIALFSPWTDLSLHAQAMLANPRKNPDPVMTADVLRTCGTLYTYAENFANPQISPIYAPENDLAVLPPVFIQAGGNELLLADITRFAEKITAAGAECTLDIWPEMCHLFQFVEEYTKDAHVAVEKAGAFIKRMAQANPDKSGDGGFTPENGIM